MAKLKTSYLRCSADEAEQMKGIRLMELLVDDEKLDEERIPERVQAKSTVQRVSDDFDG